MSQVSATRSATQAKLTLERIRGVHAVAIHKRRGRDYLDIVTQTRNGRMTREVAVYSGRVADVAVAGALRNTLGELAAREFVQCF